MKKILKLKIKLAGLRKKLDIYNKIFSNTTEISGYRIEKIVNLGRNIGETEENIKQLEKIND